MNFRKRNPVNYPTRSPTPKFPKVNQPNGYAAIEAAALDFDVAGRQRLPQIQEPASVVLRSHQDGCDFNDPAIGQHERIRRGRLPLVTVSLDEDRRSNLSIPATAITNQVAFVDGAGGGYEPVAAIAVLKHEMVKPTVPQFGDRVLQPLRFELKDGNAIGGVKEIVEPVWKALKEHA